MGIRQCRLCKARIHSGSAFCPYCGAVVRGRDSEGRDWTVEVSGHDADDVQKVANAMTSQMLENKSQPEPRIFLSYRRDDSEDVIGRVYDQLRIHFGSENVFKDVDSIRAGADFRDAILDALKASDYVLVAIGSEWLDQRSPDGARRLDEDGDYVRLEIETALKHGKRVIPVLIGDTQMPPAEALPEPIRHLAYRNATRVRPDPDFHNDMKRLIQALVVETVRSVALQAQPHQLAALPLHFLIVAIFGLLALTSIGGGIYAIARDSESDTQLTILGAELSTGHVGVALVGIGFIITFFTIRAVLKNQRDLAALPLDR